MKTCTKCKETKPVSQFRRHAAYKGGRHSHCIPCEKTYQKSRNAEKRERNRQIKQEVIEHYGGVCSCCGEDIQAFLTIDHVKQNGSEHRKKHGLSPGTDTYKWIKRNNYPKDFQVLCFNCNCGRSVNGGVCPHQGRIR
jgi:hypothetical protein